jgi:ribosome recycling factor
MKKTIEKMKSDFSALRTGRASTGLLEGIRVESYGTMMPLNQLASMNIPDARTIEIHPWDVSQLTSIEKAIQKSELGLTPVNDGKIIRMSVPALTEDRRKDIIKSVHKMAEEYKVAVRNERRQILESIKKAEKDKKITEDDRKKGENDLQKVTDAFIKKIDEMLAVKEKDVMEV